MKLRPLQSSDLSDNTSFVTHLTGRRGELGPCVSSEIADLSPSGRLKRILSGRTIKAHKPFARDELKPVSSVVSFSACTIESLCEQVAGGRHEPWGLAFRKDYIFRAHGGSPALYVCADHWDGLELARWPRELRSLVVRYWPGASGDDVGRDLIGPSVWDWEREWRVVGDVQFRLRDVEFIIVGDRALRQAPEGITQKAFKKIPQVVINGDGEIIEDQYRDG